MPSPRVRAQHTALIFLCPHTGCIKGCHSPGGLKRHITAVHPKHIQHPVHVQLPETQVNTLDEDEDDHPEGPLDSDVEPPARAVTHHHPTIDG